MPRLFTGFEIPLSVTETLAQLRHGLPGARWIDVEHYHLTLRFIGDVDFAMARDIAELLDDSRPPVPFSITLDTLSAFGGDKPHSLYARAVPAPELMELQENQERLMRKLGLPPDKRKFTPHVTLARLRDISPASVAGYLAAQGHFRPLTFTPSKIILYSARDSVGGGPYVREAMYPFLYN
jgi:RNA 2',3'-cyclic 3'-phosphodiesterase